MRTIKYIHNLAPLLEKPTFKSIEARNLGVSSSLLAYYVKKGIIVRVSHGIYKGTDAQANVDFQWQDLVITARSISNGVICLISALSIYKLTEEIPRALWIAVPNSTTAPTRDNTIIKRMRDCETGKINYQLGGEGIVIFDKERTILDAFRYLSKEVALKALSLSLSGEHKIDVKKLQRYSKKLRINITPYLQTLLSIQ